MEILDKMTHDRGMESLISDIKSGRLTEISIDDTYITKENTITKESLLQNVLLEMVKDGELVILWDNVLNVKVYCGKNSFDKIISDLNANR